MNFRTFLEHNPLHIPMPVGGNTVGTHNDMATAAFAATASNDFGIMGGLPDIDLSATSVARVSKVRKVLNGPSYVYDDKRRHNDLSNRSPVKIQMDDGTVIEMPIERFNDLWNSGTKIQPPSSKRPGTKLQVMFQRNPTDTSISSSKIDSIKVL